MPVKHHLSSNKLHFFVLFVEAKSFRAIVRVGFRNEVTLTFDNRVAKEAPANLGLVICQISLDCLHEVRRHAQRNPVLIRLHPILVAVPDRAINTLRMLTVEHGQLTSSDLRACATWFQWLHVLSARSSEVTPPRRPDPGRYSAQLPWYSHGPARSPTLRPKAFQVLKNRFRRELVTLFCNKLPRLAGTHVKDLAQRPGVEV
jgi:hypothetical protein